MPVPFLTRRAATIRWFMLYAFLATLIGCYKYVPTTMDAVPTGDHVRALLSTEAQQDVALRMGRLYTVLEGKLLEKTENQILVSIPTVKVAGQYGSQSLYQRIDVTRQGVVRLDVRQVDKFRTYGLVGMAAGAAALLTAKVFAGGDPGSPNGRPPAPNEHRRGGLLRLIFFRW